MKENSPHTGITLLELMVVIAIIGIMTSIAVGGLNSMVPKMRLNSAVRDLISNMQKARLEAVKRNTGCRVVFDTNNSRYAISIGSGADDTWSTIGDNSNLTIVDLGDYGSGVGYGSGDAEFDATEDEDPITGDFVSYNADVATYNSRGTSSAGYVYLSNQSNDTYAVGTQSTGILINKKWSGNSWE